MTFNKKKLKKSLKIGIIGSSSVILGFILSLFPFFESIEFKLYDAWFQLRGPVNDLDSNIVLVAIDDQTFASLPSKWPFPRTYFAHLINNLKQGGAKFIVLDVEFTEPNTQNIRQDFILAQTIKAAGNVILAGKLVNEIGSHDTENSYFLKPIPLLEKAAHCWGLVNVIEDPDGFIRKYLLFINQNKMNIYPLSIQLLKAFKNIEGQHFIQNKRELFVISDVLIPKYTFNSMLINYRGPAGTFPTYSFSNILDDVDFNLGDKEDTNIFEYHKRAGTFRDKIVFVGASAEELQDNKLTPFFNFDGKKRKLPGVEMHANAFSTIINGDFILPLPSIWIVFIVIFFSILSTIIAIKLSPFWSSFAILLAIISILILSFYLFVDYLVWAPPIFPSLTTFFSYSGNVIHKVLNEQQEKRRYRKTFERYVAKSVVDTMLKKGELPKLGGERKTLTVLFSDIRGFTTFSEKYEPEMVAQYLQEYLTAMTEIIIKHNGTLDKFVGDEIMAVYGAPLFYKEHALLACKTALEMVAGLRKIQQKLSQRKIDYFQIGIGMNTGKMIVGNLGSSQLFDYTVIGDEVNLAARLESANKQYWTTIIISESTYQEVKDVAIIRELDYVIVKGKNKPVRIYELRGLDSIPDIEQDLIINTYTRGFALYKDQKWCQAIKEFRKVLRYFPSDGPSRIYTQRCLNYITDPPPSDWNGIYTLKNK